MPSFNLLVGLTLFSLLLALVLLGKRRPARSPAWLLLRSLFPSWRFFEQIAPVPTLSYRVAVSGSDLGGWQDALPPVARTPLSLVLNARGNLHLAQQSLVERLSDELDGDATPETVVESVSYGMVQRLVLAELRRRSRGDAPIRYQFRLTLPEPSTRPGPRTDEDLFLSAVHDG